MNIEAIYKTIAPKLTNWLVSTGSSYHEACDLVQSTFLKRWKMRDDLHGDNMDVSGLAFTIARNLRKNLVRDGSRLEGGRYAEVPVDLEAIPVFRRLR